MNATDPPRNHLAGEKSPYLLQHAANPVDWYPWGEEAFARARAENKPIFLSVGYSTCHWCHVMERESFENEETAALLREHFISIKVDREERPDVDRVYMAYVQAISGSGGWPMSVWLTPKLEPFFGGTYFPPDGAYGRPGFPTLLRKLAEAWQQDRQEIERTAGNALSQLGRSLRGSSAVAATAVLDETPLLSAFEGFRRNFDARFGGFSNAPKFPRPVTHEFLLRVFDRRGDESAARMVQQTLHEMGKGGVNDQLAGGFHRYSVDRVWHVPHFEKMLYDQAQLAISYLEAYQLDGDVRHATQARAILDYVLCDLTDAESGAFYSAEDADSLIDHEGTEKREGAFYVWTYDELRELLGSDFELFAERYGVVEDGNADDPHGELTGTNVLHVLRELDELAEEFGLTEDRLETRLAAARATLLRVRATRPRPHLDDKVLSAWNGMMIGALARAAQVLDDARYLEAARRAATFVSETLWQADDRILLRRYRDGEAAVDGYLEDYAQLAEGLCELYEASFELRWLELAEALTDRQIELFAAEDGGFYSSDGRDPSVLLRLKDDYDGAEPSGNSTAAIVLFRLAALLGRDDYRQRAEATIRASSQRLDRIPEALPRMLVALDLALRPPAEIVITGALADAHTQALLRAARTGFAPNKVVRLLDDAFLQRYGERLPHLAAMSPDGDQARAYLCRDRACQAPTREADELRGQLLAKQLSPLD